MENNAAMAFMDRLQNDNQLNDYPWQQWNINEQSPAAYMSKMKGNKK